MLRSQRFSAHSNEDFTGHTNTESFLKSDITRMHQASTFDENPSNC